MAEITNRQVLINLHSAANDATAEILNLGEIAIKHNNVTGATIFTKTTDGKVAKFITDVAVDNKIAVVNSALTEHKNAYNLKMAALDAVDAGHDEDILDAQNRIKALEDAMGGEDGVEGNVMTRLAAVESKATTNAANLSQEISARESGDTAIRGEFAAEDAKLQAAIDALESNKATVVALNQEISARESADTEIRKDFGDADAQIRLDFAAEDAKLLGTSGDSASATTIHGVKKAAAAAQAAADAAQGAADAAQADATQAVAQHDGYHPIEAQRLVLGGFLHIAQAGQYHNNQPVTAW